MILEKLENYRLYLNWGYDFIERKEHLGVADKFLLKQKFNLEIIKELNADKIDYESTCNKEPSLDIIIECYNKGISRAAKRVFLENKEYF